VNFKITSLKPQKRRKDRISVFLDGEFAFGLEETTALGLSVGQNLTESEVDSLKKLILLSGPSRSPFGLLSLRPRSTVEIRSTIYNESTVEEDIINRVIDRLQELELLDDLAFARYWVEAA